MRRWEIFRQERVMFFRERMKVESKAMNQHVEPFLPIYFGSREIRLSLERIDRLSNSQYSKKKTLVTTLSKKSSLLMTPIFPTTSISFPYSFKLLNSRNSFLASRIAQNKASIFFSLTLSPFFPYWYFRNRQEY